MSGHDESDHALARRVRRGEIAAFERLFRRLHAPLCEVVDSYVGSQAVAEELVQDLFLAVWIDRARLRLVLSPRAYLFGAARNRAVQYLRHRVVARRYSEQARLDPETALVAGSPPSPHEVVEAAETSSMVRAAIDTLPPRTRLAFVLQQEHDMTNAQIATAMNVSLKAVEKLLSIARAKLRERLRDEAPELR